MGAYSSDDVGTHRDIRYELTVHNVPLDAVNASVLQRATFVAKLREIGWQYRRHNFDRARSR
jgi:hypothetical protein